MFQKSVTVALLLSGVEALKIGSRGVSGSMSCQECVVNAHNYCLKGTPWSSVSAGGSAPTATCCPSSGCSGNEHKSSEYFCFEDKFASVDFAIAACPMYEDNCGVSKELYLGNIGDTQTVEFTNLKENKPCTFKIIAASGAPSFKITDDSSDLQNANFDIAYTSYDADKIKTSGAWPQPD